ncbi:GTPase-activating protein CdGAPr [Gryllus bimaculatus]|nr:GTPase-activating protein CdGAPr [Gryllus bimaculatus]
MASAVPVPKPRTNIVDGQSKKPIPKPRQKVVVSTPCAVSENETVCCVKCNAKILNECACATLQVSKHNSIDTCGRSKQNAESKRIVGGRLEKSMKNITRRFTTRPLSPGKEGKLNQSKVLRSHSLPSESAFNSLPVEDIFQSITFKSPIAVTDSENGTLPVDGSDQAEEEIYPNTYNAPPPIYPPPPLPDESVYDEVQSVALSGSGSSNVSSSGSAVSHKKTVVSGVSKERVYEPIAIEFAGDATSSKPLILPENISSGNNSVPSVCVTRSDSWSFYDSVFGDKSGSEDGTTVVPSGKDSVSFSERTWSRNSVSPSLLSELDALGCISEDENFEDDNVSFSSASTPRSISVQNEMYDAWEPLKAAVTLRRKETERNAPSKSVILEFDPLFSRTNALPIDNNNEDIFLQSGVDLLTTEEAIYGNINQVSKEKKNIVRKHSYDEVSIECPPVPPRRVDSISPTPSKRENTVQIDRSHRETLGAVCEIRTEDEHALYLKNQRDELGIPSGSSGSLQKALSSDDVSMDKKQPRKLTRLASMRQAVRRVADRSPNVLPRTPKLGISLRDPIRNPQTRQEKQKKAESDTRHVERPEISPQLNFPHSGLVFKVAIGKEKQQDYVHRWCVLAEDKLTFYADKTATAMKELITLPSILSLQVITDRKISVDGDCFEINTSSKTRSYVFGTSGPSERRIWMQKILESLTSVFPLRVISDYTRGGWCYLKEGISGKWSAAWILIHKRTFYYCLEKVPIQEIDLRKARCVALQDSNPDTSVLRVSTRGPSLLLDCQGLALYLHMDTPIETRVWQKIIQSSAVDNGPNLDQQQLTKDDIPVIVDKCIKFVYAHGSMSEGIYRRSGANSCVSKLLEMFRLDAWSVQLSRQEYTEYDVSSVLKRFFRDIPEPLLTTELHGQFCDIAAGKFKEDKVALYRRTLEQLPPVNYLTTRKLISHLHSIHEQREKNRMPLDNLAAIWGPTLMHIETSESLEWSKNETAVVADLITYHVQLFEVNDEELNREKLMQEVLERINSSSTSLPQSKPSGELHVWVYLNNRDSGNCVHITAGPQKLAGEVCADLAERMKIPSHELVLQEVVCGGSLMRFLHHTEKVLDTVLRWSYWDECDRKDNSLVVMKNDILKEVVPLAKPPLAMSGELRYADKKSKSFKPFVFEFSQAKLCYYKDKKGSVKMSEWKIEDIVWYLGYEPKRNPQTRWSITFIEKNKPTKRSKDSPYFGNTIAGTSKDEQLRWMAALLIGEYPQGLFMSPTLLT